MADARPAPALGRRCRPPPQARRTLFLLSTGARGRPHAHRKSTAPAVRHTAAESSRRTAGRDHASSSSPPPGCCRSPLLVAIRNGRSRTSATASQRHTRGKRSRAPGPQNTAACCCIRARNHGQQDCHITRGRCGGHGQDSSGTARRATPTDIALEGLTLARYGGELRNCVLGGDPGRGSARVSSAQLWQRANFSVSSLSP